MKLIRRARVFIVLLVLTLLFTGCADQKVQPQTPDGTDGQIENLAGSNNNGTGNTAELDGGEKNTQAGQDSEPLDSEQGQPYEKAETNEDDLIKVKALYLTGWIVGSSKRVEHYVELANTTEINAYVVDIKDDDGFVGYESQVPEVQANGTWKKKYNPDTVLKEFHDNDIYVIGRLVVFKDPLYSIKRPDLAIKNKNGGLWKEKGKSTWLNPYNKENWDYTISIAKEAVEKGFDEIQFDYTRFPGNEKSNPMDFSGIEQEKYEAICEFLAYAKEKIPEVPISADVFGIILESPKDTENIGQYLEFIGKDIDYICPMVYPSHYAIGQIVNNVKFNLPDHEPYGVVYNSLVKGKSRIDQVEGYNAKVRPYLQDFTASWLKDKKGNKLYIPYEEEQVRLQIQAVYDAGYEEWIFWDAKNTYHEEAFLKEGEQQEASVDDKTAMDGQKAEDIDKE
jgi:hypothetical protein